MPKTLNKPKNPEFLAATVAAMRLLSGARQPSSPLEQEVLAALHAKNLKVDVAKRIVATFDAKPQADRERLLGHFADRNFAMESTLPAEPPHVVVRDHRTGSPSGGTTSNSSTSRVGHTSDTAGPLPHVATTGVTPGIRYTVRYKGLWCQKETDGPGSDEIYIITSGLTINQNVNDPIEAITHPKGTHDSYYGDVDTWDQRAGPIAVAWTGSPDTLSLAVIVMEHDEGDPDYYRDEVDTFVTAAIAVGAKLWTPIALLALFKGSIVDAINWILGTGDDVISSEVVIFERPELEALAVQPPVLYQGKKWPVSNIGVPVGPSYNFQTDLVIHFVTTHHGDGAEYVVGFDIERDPPRPDHIIV
jgi:hypothetical protein